MANLSIVASPSTSFFEKRTCPPTTVVHVEKNPHLNISEISKATWTNSYC
jgi:hypothetical protein